MSALTKITARAKQLRKKTPGKKWSSLIKQAGADYRAGKLGKVASTAKKVSGTKRKKSVRKKVARKKRSTRTVRKGQAVRVKHVIAGTVAHHLGAARAKIKEQIGWAEAQKFAATKKVAKRKIARHIAKLKVQYRKTI